MDRRDTLLGLIALGAAPLVSMAQPKDKVWRIGFLGVGSASYLNLSSAAKALGLRIPQSLLARADRVVE